MNPKCVSFTNLPSITRAELFSVVVAILSLMLQSIAVAGQDAATGNSSRVQALLTERLATLKEVAKLAAEEYRTGNASFDEVARAQLDVLNAELELCQDPKKRIEIRQNYLKVTKELEDAVTRLFQAGAAGRIAVLAAKANRLEAEIALEKEKVKSATRSK